MRESGIGPKGLIFREIHCLWLCLAKNKSEFWNNCQIKKKHWSQLSRKICFWIKNNYSMFFDKKSPFLNKKQFFGTPKRVDFVQQVAIDNTNKLRLAYAPFFEEFWCFKWARFGGKMVYHWGFQWFPNNMWSKKQFFLEKRARTLFLIMRCWLRKISKNRDHISW